MTDRKGHSPEYTATMLLPKGGKRTWSDIMHGDTKLIPAELDTYSPIVMQKAFFEDGTWVVGGVYKSAEPDEYNVKFFWVFDARGTQYPGWIIDTSDDEDFLNDQVVFSLTEDDDKRYLLYLTEA